MSSQNKLIHCFLFLHVFFRLLNVAKFATTWHLFTFAERFIIILSSTCNWSICRLYQNYRMKLNFFLSNFDMQTHFLSLFSAVLWWIVVKQASKCVVFDGDFEFLSFRLKTKQSHFLSPHFRIDPTAGSCMCRSTAVFATSHGQTNW